MGTRWTEPPDELNGPGRQLVGELRALKDGSRMSLAEIGARTHYSRASWERWFNGKRLVTRPALTSFAVICRTDAAPLLALLDEAVLEPRPDAVAYAPIDVEQTGGAVTVRGRSGHSAGPDAPARRIAVPLSQLPPDIGDFSGRRSHVGALADILTAAQHRSDPPAADADHAGPAADSTDPGPSPGPEAGAAVAVVSGCGGVGKTTLAVRVARQVAQLFPDGQLYVDLRGAGSCPRMPSEVLARFLRDLGVAPGDVPADEEDRSTLYRSVLARTRMLVLLDNARDSAQVRPLLPAEPGCAVLVTSRRRLDALPGAARIDLDLMQDDDAQDLLSAVVGPERVAAEPAGARALIEQCRGLPLALRIAGARLAARPDWRLDELAGRLADAQGLDELEVDDLAVRNAFAVTYTALRDSDRPGDRDAARAFRILGVWPGHDLETQAAAALLDRPLRHAEQALEALVDARLLQSRAPGRYRFHDLIRSYGAELARGGLSGAEATAALERIAAWYLHSAVAANHALIPARALPRHSIAPPPELPVFHDGTEALAWYSAERLNILAIVGWPGSAVLDQASWRTANSLVPVFRAGLHNDDWAAVHLAALPATRRLDDHLAEREIRGSLINSYREQGRLKEAMAAAEEALDIARDRADFLGQALHMQELAYICRRLSRREEAVAWSEQGVALRRVHGGTPFGFASALNGLGIAYHAVGRYPQALAAYEECLLFSRKEQDRYNEGYVLDSVGETQAALGRFAEAEESFREAEAICRELGDEAACGQILDHLGSLLVAAGRPGEGLAVLQEAHGILDRIEYPGADALARRVAALAEAVERADRTAAAEPHRPARGGETVALRADPAQGPGEFGT
ncbi:MAG TPA: tetratricopeptide repeat protein [Actinocrinis sp.]